MEMVAETSTPHHQAYRTEHEGQYQTPEAEFGLEVATAALCDGGDEPVADGPP